MAGTKDFEVGRRRWLVVAAGTTAFGLLMAGLLLLLPGAPRDAAVTAYAVEDAERLVVQLVAPPGEQLRRIYVDETDGRVSVRAVVTSQPWRPWPTHAAGQPQVLNAVVDLGSPLDGRAVVGLDGRPLPESSTTLLLDAGPLTTS